MCFWYCRIWEGVNLHFCWQHLALDAQFTVLSPQRSLFKLHGFISNLGFFLQIICFVIQWVGTLPFPVFVGWFWGSKNLLGSHFFRCDYPMGWLWPSWDFSLGFRTIARTSLVGIQPGLRLYTMVILMTTYPYEHILYRMRGGNGLLYFLFIGFQLLSSGFCWAAVCQVVILRNHWSFDQTCLKEVPSKRAPDPMPCEDSGKMSQPISCLEEWPWDMALHLHASDLNRQVFSSFAWICLEGNEGPLTRRQLGRTKLNKTKKSSKVMRK